VKVFFILFTISLLSGSATPARAQGGGKAEPKRIEFTRGTDSTAIKDSIRRTEEDEYVFSAREGQKITISLTPAAPKSALLRLRKGADVLSSWGFDGTGWSGTAPATGDYLVTVLAAPRAPRRITYTLRLAIK
jgi:hypothetical protein